jgi:hypothetical protein
MRYRPQLVSTLDSVWNTVTSPKTISVTVKAGDFIIVIGIIEGQATTSSDTLAVSGGSLSWSTAVKTNVAGFCHISEQHATATSDTTFNVSIAHTGNTALWFGGNATVWRGSDGLGTPVTATNASGAPSLAVTTGAANSTILSFVADFNAADDSARAWRAINGITPTAGNGFEISHQFLTSHYTLSGAYWNDAGAAGSKTTGQTAITGQKYSILSIEIKGTNRVAPVIFKQAVNRASTY